MNEDRDVVLFRVERKTGILILATLFVLIGGLALSEQLTLTTSYPVPSGIYNQLVTTGNSGSVSADTTLNRNAGNTILVPSTNPSGRVGIGTTTPGGGANALLTIQGLPRTDPPSGPVGTQVDLVINGRMMTGDSLDYGGVWVNGTTRTQFVGQGGPPMGTDGTPGAPNNLILWNRNFALQVDPNQRIAIDAAPATPLTDSLTIGTFNGNNGNITAGGTITSNSPSDARLKKNISPVSGALAKMSGLRPVSFEWKDEVAKKRNYSRDAQWGLLAQDVKKVLPELVTQDPDGFLRVKYGPELNMLALAAIKELQAKTESQQKKIDELEARLNAPRGK
jgi:hypothetical protein